jgi:DNA-binding CsgD family transcriptional regulator/tetratricopeptide (TPR) repeat protein
MRLLEREPQLSALTQYAQDARHGQGRLVLVTGEAGAGKTALLEQLEQVVEDAEWSWGACDGLFTPRPLAPLVDIAGQLGGDLLELTRKRAPREDLFDALLRRISTPGLTVLAIEDVHWADESTLDLLRFLGRRIRNAEVLLLVSYRDEGLAADDPLRLALGELASQRATRRLQLPNLTEDAVAELVGGTDVEPGGLYRLTSGNPFFVTEVIHTHSRELPASARDAVLARVAGLSSAAREVLEVAALIGSRIPPALLESVTGAAPVVLDELVGCGVLTGDGDELRFRHEIARRAVETGIAPHRCLQTHRALLVALEAETCDDDARLAFHAEGAADTARVMEYAPRAGRRASDLAAHREAAVQFARALRCAPTADARTRATLNNELANELSLVDRWQDSADAREAALGLWREVGDPLREGDTLRRLSRTMWRLCRGRDADRAAAAAVAALEPLGPSPELAWAYANLANQRMNTDPDGASGLARRAVRIAEDLALDDVLSDALNTEACAAYVAKRDWLDTLLRSLEVARAGGHAEQAGRAYTNLYGMHCGELDLVSGEPYFVEGLAYCEEHDIGTFATCLRGERSASLEKLGRWDEAETLAQQLLRPGGGASPVNRLNPLVTLGKVRARRGDPRAWECLDEALEAAVGVGEPGWLVHTRVARAEASWLEGDVATAIHELDLASESAVLSEDVQRGWVAAWQHRISGTRAAGQVEPFASQIADDPRGAARMWEERGCRYDAALALLDATDDQTLREALARLDQLGASAASRVARRRMRDLGIASIPTGARASTRSHPLGLTPREHEVLELICEGHTNDEISEDLFISVKTVSHHVSAVLEKLGVPSRRVAATEARRLGLVGASH